MNDIKVLLLAANTWDFNDEKTGEQRKGVTVHVCHLDDIPNENTIGKKPVKYSLPFEKSSMFTGKELPAYALMQCTFDFGRGKIVPVEFTKITPLEVGAVGGQSRS